jgi:hypothetical protein
MADVIGKWEELRTLFESLEVDVKKTAKGNKTAGVRSRKGLRLLKKAASDLVKETLDAGKDETPAA